MKNTEINIYIHILMSNLICLFNLVLLNFFHIGIIIFQDNKVHLITLFGYG